MVAAGAFGGRTVERGARRTAAPSKPHRAHTVGALPGEPQSNFHPSGNRTAHGSVVRGGIAPPLTA